MGFVLWTGGQLNAQCPSLKAIMVNPCGADVRNEFLILDSGSGFNTQDLQISFDASANGENRQNNDININIDNFPAETRPCRFQPGDASLITGCDNIQVVSQGEEIPPNAIVIIQMSGDADETYDFSYLCGNGECVYVLQNDCIRTKEAFSNQGSGEQTTLIAVGNTQCSREYTYDRDLLDGGNGAFYAPQGTTTYGNRGCGVVPPIRGGTIPPQFVNPGNLLGCGSFTLPAITGMDLTGGELYYTGPYGTGISYPPGAEITRSTTFFIYDHTAPCSPLEMFRVNILDPLIPTLDVPNPLCAQDTPYSLPTIQDSIRGNWTGDNVSNNLFTPDVINGGIYTLTFVPEPDECAGSNSIQVEVLPTPVATTDIRATACNGNGAGNGIFNLTSYASQVNGGTNDQVFWYEDIELNQVIEDSTLYASGEKEIYAVIDNGACRSNPVPVALSVGSPPVIRFTTIKSLSCFGDVDGGLEIEISEGSPPYEIEWSAPAYNGQTTLENLSAGPYSVTVTDSLGCSASQTVNLIEPEELILECNKLEDAGSIVDGAGVASFTASGGVAPYWVVWEGPETDSALILSAGDTLTVDTLRMGRYDIRLRDALGCVTFCEVDIDGPNCELEASSSFVPPSCFGNSDGSITITTSGAQGALTYRWSVSSLDGQSAPRDLPAGQYEITVSDGIGCMEVLSITLEAPPLIDLNCQVQNSVSVLGGRDGRARIQVSGGTPPYLATWTGPESDELSIGMPTEFMIDNLPAGTYELLVTDANDCVQSCSFTIEEGNCSSELEITAINETCPDAADGGILLELTGNWIEPVTYDWSNDDYDGRSQLDNLPAGNYAVTVTGSNGCQASATAVVGTEFSLPELNFTPSVSICRDACASLELSFIGTPPFFAEFILRHGNQNTPLSVNTTQSTASLQICPADYGATSGDLQLQLLRVSDNHCINETPMESRIEILAPTEFEYTSTICPNESVTINGQVYDMNRPTGTEILPGANQFGCDSIVNIQLNFEAEAVTAIQETLCPDGSITVNGQIYDIDRPAGMEVIPTDNGCDSIINVDLSFYPPAVGRLEEVLCPGEERVINGTTYNEQRTSGTEVFPGGSINGCDSILEVSITYYEEAVGLLNETICPDEEIVINGTSYNRENPEGFELFPGGAESGCDSVLQIQLNFFDPPLTILRDTLCPDGSLTLNGTTYDINRPGGVEVFPSGGANGCDSLVQVELVFQEDVTVGLLGDQDICQGETASLSFQITNALSPVDIQYTVNEGDPVWVYGVENGDQISVAPAGNATYTIVQALVPPEFCTVTITGSATVRVSDLMADAVIESDYSGYGVSCDDKRDGALSAVVMSGTAPFTYVWQDGVRSPERTNLGPGVYSVMVTDAFGCSAEALAQLEAPPPVQVQLSSIPLDCNGGSSGAIIIDTIYGGNPPYFFRLDGGSPQLVGQFPYLINGVAAGRHTVEVSDEFGCGLSREVVIADFSPLELILGPDQEIRYGQSVRLDGVANFQIDSLVWTPTDSLTPPNTLPTRARPATTTIYELTAYDSRGCSVSDKIKVTVSRGDDIFVPNAFTPNHDGINDRVYPFTNPNIKIIDEFRIFDRWGNQMHFQEAFQGNLEEFGWDGRLNNQPMDPAVFIFVVRFTYLDGRKGMLKGDVTLVR